MLAVIIDGVILVAVQSLPLKINHDSVMYFSALFLLGLDIYILLICNDMDHFCIEDNQITLTFSEDYCGCEPQEPLILFMGCHCI